MEELDKIVKKLPNQEVDYFKIGKILISPFIGINNFFDESYNANVRINAFGKRFFEPGPDRNLYAGVNLRFDFR